MSDMISVEVVYALPDRQELIEMEVPRGTTLFEAARDSGIAGRFPDLDLEHVGMGVFGKEEKHPRERVLEEGDRVEIYRPLEVDPKARRRARANRSR